jgi:small-conductance mechanosensitive channel
MALAYFFTWIVYVKDSDEISSTIGPNANGIASGKDINQATNTTNIVSGGLDTILNHLIVMRGELSVIKEDVRQARIERVGLIEIVNDLIDRIETIRDGIYPQWLRWVMVSLAAIAIFIATLTWVRANSQFNIDWLATGIYIFIVVSTLVHVATLFFVIRLWTILRGSLRGAVDSLVDDRIHGTVTELAHCCDA